MVDHVKQSKRAALRYANRFQREHGECFGLATPVVHEASEIPDVISGTSADLVILDKCAPEGED